MYSGCTRVCYPSITIIATFGTRVIYIYTYYGCSRVFHLGMTNITRFGTVVYLYSGCTGYLPGYDKYNQVWYRGKYVLWMNPGMTIIARFGTRVSYIYIYTMLYTITLNTPLLAIRLRRFLRRCTRRAVGARDTRPCQPSSVWPFSDRVHLLPVLVLTLLPYITLPFLLALGLAWCFSRPDRWCAWCGPA